MNQTQSLAFYLIAIKTNIFHVIYLTELAIRKYSTMISIKQHINHYLEVLGANEAAFCFTWERGTVTQSFS